MSKYNKKTQRKYVAEVSDETKRKVAYEIDGWGASPQEFHKTVLFEHTKYPKEEILSIKNQKGHVVFDIRWGFSGS
jgi:hypothetical protein|tara:strand:- start:4338 stop:4565 length:228 start_codon:yes stop_codon:yes gene_type:complete